MRYRKLVSCCLFFDFGNVIAFFDHRKACRQLAMFSNGMFTDTEIYDELFQAGGLEQRFDRGKISSEKFINEIDLKFNLSASAGEIEHAWCDIYSLNDPIIELLLNLKDKGYQLFLASNTNELHYRWIKEKYACELSVFGDEVVSFKIGFLKPEKEFFEYCVDRSGVPSSQCIFIDDRLDFVKVACEIGLSGICYSSISFLLNELREHRVKV